MAELRCDHDFRWNHRGDDEQSCKCVKCGQVRVIPVATTLEQVMHEHSKRPRCAKCGTPDVLWFEGAVCLHGFERSP
jgi:NAD-dependent SIR2 family protein deacetylase